MSTVISVENVSKQYRLGEIGTGSIAHDVNRWWHRIRGKEDPYLKIGQVNDRARKAETRSPEAGTEAGGAGGGGAPRSAEHSRLAAASADYAWALRDVSFEVRQGEVLGIIGRNGAGKSTLLKILSRVTRPTTGEIRVKGRIASLLEVGTGFHPELTGRENIFLNGAILGMRKTEIIRKFDEIVDFSGCARYIDTPVKRYSSGMYVRLAFAVAAHLEPEILIVDEVLAVGDAEFQKKCLGKMKDVAGEGRTVLFVSHNMAAVYNLCGRGLFLKFGMIAADARIGEVMRQYMTDARTELLKGSLGSYRNRGNAVRITKAEMLVDGVPSRTIASGFKCEFVLHYETLSADAVGRELSVSLGLYDETDLVTNLWTNYTRGRGIRLSDKGEIRCVIERWPFREFTARLDIYSHIGTEVQDWIEECLLFDSTDGDYYGSGVVGATGQGVVFINHEWRSEPCP
jgi:lipopolysaccharide transport system ATP-binding protein